MRNIAAFPLAIPLMADPGAITAVVLLAGRAGGDPLHLGVLLGVVAVVLALCFAVFISPRASRRCSEPPAMSCCRACSACYLAALAVQFVIDGVRAALARARAIPSPRPLVPAESGDPEPHLDWIPAFTGMSGCTITTALRTESRRPCRLICRRRPMPACARAQRSARSSRSRRRCRRPPRRRRACRAW